MLDIIAFSWLNRKHIKGTTIQHKALSYYAELESSVAKKGEAGRVLYDEALRYQKEGTVKDAKKKYLQALKVSPNFVFALNNLGVIYMSERNYFEARRLFEKAIKLKPDYVDPHYNLACLCAQGNNRSGCVSHLKTAIGLDKRVREWARADKDLRGLRGYPKYEELMIGK